jgi:Zn-finger nucleic acid-binding protein
MSTDFQESALKCPNCSGSFVIVKEPDIEYEKCPTCNGVFLDEGELNLIATGLAGDVELYYIKTDEDEEDEDYQQKKCPKCQVLMQKAQFGNYSNIFFDYCNECSGSFLNVSKEKQINDYLRSITTDQLDEEYRDYVNSILVRVDIEKRCLASSRQSLIISHDGRGDDYLIITAFYKKPLNIDLIISQENLLFRITKMLVRNDFGDMQTGDKEFDKHFKIHATDEVKLMTHLTEIVTSSITEFIKKAPTVYGIHGKLKLLDDRVIYREGPYTNSPVYRENTNFYTIIQDLVELAGLMH